MVDYTTAFAAIFDPDPDTACERILVGTIMLIGVRTTSILISGLAAGLMR